MPFVPIKGFIGGSYSSRARGVSVARTVNMRVERSPADAAFSAMLYTRSGKKLFATLPAGPVQGSWGNKTRAFFASGGEIRELFRDGSTTLFGSVPIGNNPVTMRANGTQLLICSAGNVYIATGGGMYQPIVNFASGQIYIAAGVVVWVSGDKFTGAGTGDIKPGDLFMVQDGLDSKLYAVNVVTDSQHLTLVAYAGGPVPPANQFSALAPTEYQAGDGTTPETTLLRGATCEFIDGYFIVSIPNSKQFRISNLNNGRKWDELDSGVKSGSTDNIATVFDLGGQLALIGDNNSTELWGDSGNSDFPFQRIGGRSMNSGTAAAWSVAKLPDGSLCWLASTLQGENLIVRTTGGEPVRISDHGIENEMRKYSRVYDAVGTTYLEGGHSFYRIDFPTANRTWEYDATAGVWTEMGIATAQDEVYAADRGRFGLHITWPNTGERMNLAGDYTSGKIWQVDPDFVDDDGVDFPVMRIAPHLNTDLMRMNCSGFALHCALGVIDQTAVGPDGKPLIPTVGLQYSVNGGNTWLDAGAAALGRSGEYEGVELTEAEMGDLTANSQTNPQVFEALPIWRGMGAFKISMTFKIKTVGRMLRAVHNGLVEIAPQ